MVGLMATSFAEKAALWQLYGKTRMATLASLALLQLNSLKYGVPQLGSPEVLALVRDLRYRFFLILLKKGDAHMYACTHGNTPLLYDKLFL